MKYVYTFLACYICTFIFAWYWAGKRVVYAARIMKNQGMPDHLIDEHFKNMSGPTWLMSIRMTLVTGSILGVLISIALVIAT